MNETRVVCVTNKIMKFASTVKGLPLPIGQFYCLRLTNVDENDRLKSVNAMQLFPPNMCRCGKEILAEEEFRRKHWYISIPVVWVIC